MIRTKMATYQIAGRILIGSSLLSVIGWALSFITIAPALGRYWQGTCGDWAPADWRTDPRCHNDNFEFMVVGLILGWSGFAAALVSGIVWLVLFVLAHAYVKEDIETPAQHSDSA